jgi:abhydrolase domain-containing protein 6
MKRKLLGGLAVIVAAFAIVYFFFPGTLFGILAKLERNRAGVTVKKIDAGSWPTPYIEGGQGENVILLHGFGGDKDTFTRFARFLTPKYHVLSPDLPGFGENERRPNEKYSISEQAKRVITFAAALKLDKFHLVGNSMGGHLAGIVAADAPDKVLSVTLIDNAGINAPRPSERDELLKQGKNALVVDSEEDFDRLMDFLFFKRPFIPRPIKQYFAERALASREFNLKIFQDLGEDKFYLEKRFADIQAPILVIWGDHDRVLEISSIDVMKKINPAIQVKVMKDCGHTPQIERPQESAELTTAFIAGAARK